MRPGQFCPGCRAAAARGRRRPPGFNEAGAILPRMRQWRPARATALRRFNEAGAILPRMRNIKVSTQVHADVLQ